MMIQITIKDDNPIAAFITARAVQSGHDVNEIAGQVIEDSFHALIGELHTQFMNGEISQGKMAEILGIGRADLIHLLEQLNLPVTNL
jgi:hypothetical protein